MQGANEKAANFPNVTTLPELRSAITQFCSVPAAARFVSSWCNNQLKEGNLLGESSHDLVVELMAPSAHADPRIGGLASILPSVAVKWSEQRSSPLGLKISADGTVVRKLDRGPDYETAIGEHVFTTGYSKFGFRIPGKCSAIKVGVVADGFSQVGSNITSSSGGYCVYGNDGRVVNRLRASAEELRCPSFQQGDFVEVEVSFEQRWLKFRNGQFVHTFVLPVPCRLRLAACLDYSDETVICTGQVCLGQELCGVVLPSIADTAPGCTRCLLVDSLSVVDAPMETVVGTQFAPVPMRVDFSQFHPRVLEGLTNLLSNGSLHQNPLLTLKALRIFRTILHDDDARRLFFEHNSEFAATLAKLILLSASGQKTGGKEWKPTSASEKYAKTRCAIGDSVLVTGEGYGGEGMASKIVADDGSGNPYKVRSPRP